MFARASAPLHGAPVLRSGSGVEILKILETALRGASPVPEVGELWGQKDHGSGGFIVISLSGLKGLVSFNQTRNSDADGPGPLRSFLILLK